MESEKMKFHSRIFQGTKRTEQQQQKHKFINENKIIQLHHFLF